MACPTPLDHHAVGTEETPQPERYLLLVVDHFYPYVGGSETLYWNVTRALVRAGWRVRVVTRRDSGMSSQETLEGVAITRVSTPKFAQRLFFQLLAFPTIWRQSREASVIHAVVYASALPAWLSAWLRRKPFVLTVHEVFGPDWALLADIPASSSWILRSFEWLLLHLPRTNYTCGAQFTARRLQEIGGIPKERTFVVPYTVDYDFWDRQKHKARDLRNELGVPQDCFLYLYFGRPGASKGVEYLIDAVSLVSEALPNSRLVLLLGHEPRDRYERLVRRIQTEHLDSKVCLIEPVPRNELPSYLLAANCIVVPSISEGFGYSAIEAATLGCRVLSTTGHSVEEVLAGDVELVPPRDARALAAGILNISTIDEPAIPTQKRYDVSAHLSQLIAEYDRLIHKPSST